MKRRKKRDLIRMYIVFNLSATLHFTSPCNCAFWMYLASRCWFSWVTVAATRLLSLSIEWSRGDRPKNRWKRRTQIHTARSSSGNVIIKRWFWSRMSRWGRRPRPSSDRSWAYCFGLPYTRNTLTVAREWILLRYLLTKQYYTHSKPRWCGCRAGWKSRFLI